MSIPSTDPGVSPSLGEGSVTPELLPQDTMASFRGPEVTLGSLFPGLFEKGGEAAPSSKWNEAPSAGRRGSMPAVTPLGLADTDAIVLREQIGRGGFGDVFEALQSSLGRVVAVKRLREQGDHFLEAVFESEAVATAALEHPNIVPVYDLRRDAQGRPQLVMKRVRGRTWERQIAEDLNAMPFADYVARQIEVLIAVTQAVAFAHSRGVVHRDLKPSQVMVGEFGEVLLLDWGLAFVYDPLRTVETERLDDPPRWLPTALMASNPSGTVAFMAPEQTRRDVLGIGPHTDVYLLGGCLYYVLTGVPPHPAKDAAAAFYQAAQGIVRPVADAAPDRVVPKELEDIAMRAMASNPERRLKSAEAFLAALRDYVSGAGKRRQSAAAVAEARELMRTAEGYGPLGEVLVRLANAAGLWPENPDVPPLREATLARLVETALEKGDLALARHHAEAMQPGPEREARSRAVAERTDAAARMRRQRSLFLRAVVVLALLLVAGSGRFLWLRLESEERLRRERDRADRAREQVEDVLNYMMTDLRQRLEAVGRLDVLEGAMVRALGYFGEAPSPGESPIQARRRAAALGAIAGVDYARGRLDESLATYNRALAVLGPGGDSAPVATRNLQAALILGVGNVRLAQGLATEALEHFRTAASIYESVLDEVADKTVARRNVGDTWNNVAQVLRATGDSAGAVEAHQRALAIRRALVEDAPANPDFRAQLAATLSQLAQLAAEAGAAEEAEAHLSRAEAEASAAVELDAQNPAHLRRLADVFQHRARIHSRAGRRQEAAEDYRRVLAARERLAALDPGNTMFIVSLAEAHSNLASVLRGAGDAATSEDHAQHAVDLLMALTEEQRLLEAVRETEAVARANLAGARQAVGRLDEAAEQLRLARNLLREEAGMAPPSVRGLRLRAAIAADLADVLLEKGDALATEGEPDRARALWEEALAVLEGEQGGSEALRKMEALRERLGRE